MRVGQVLKLFAPFYQFNELSVTGTPINEYNSNNHFKGVIRMAYQKPICDCGEPLLIYERIGTKFKYKITKEGRRKKSSIKSKKVEVTEVTNLECQKSASLTKYNEMIKKGGSRRRNLGVVFYKAISILNSCDRIGLIHDMEVNSM